MDFRGINFNESNIKELNIELMKEYIVAKAYGVQLGSIIHPCVSKGISIHSENHELYCIKGFV